MPFNLSPYSGTTCHIDRRPSGVVAFRRSESYGDSEEHWTEFRSVKDKITDLEWRAANIQRLAQIDLSTLRWTLENDVRQWQGVNRGVLVQHLAEVARLRYAAIYRLRLAKRYAADASALRRTLAQAAE
jgi:hypothetical protein